jgi:methylated-DNA-[protein]-cysteine S-methyltransferase
MKFVAQFVLPQAWLSVVMLAVAPRCGMETLLYSRMKSPVGPLLLGMSDSALVVLAFDCNLPERLAGRPIQWRESPEATATVRQQMEEYFAGKRRKFTIPLDLRGTDFQMRCWKELLRIPYGETRSYAEIAQAVESPRAFRAVGQANHYNPIAIVVPCHRVLAAGTSLGGYGGGLPTKAFLLRLEGAEFRDDPTEANQQKALTFT